MNIRLKRKLLAFIFLAIPYTVLASEDLHIYDLSDFLFDEPHDNTTVLHAVFVEKPSIRVAVVNKTGASMAIASGNEYCDGSRVVITGGYFKNDEDGLRPHGLHINDGSILYKTEAWKSGGFLYQMTDGSYGFSHISQGAPNNAQETLQSKPFIVEEGGVAVGYNNDAMWDRIAIGNAQINNRDGLFIVAAISDLEKRQAMQLHVFAEAVVQISEYIEIDIDTMMNLDGAQGPFIWIRDSNQYYGAFVERYISSILCLD